MDRKQEIIRRLKFFDKDEIEWKEDKMFELYKNLVVLKRGHPALSNGYKIERIKTDAEDSVLLFTVGNENSRIIAFINLSDKDQKFYVKCQDFRGNWINIFAQKQETIECTNQISIGPFEYLLLENI